MQNQEPADPNSVTALVARLVPDAAPADVLDLTDVPDAATALAAAAAVLGSAALVVVAPHGASGARRLAALAGHVVAPAGPDRRGLLDLLATAGLRVTELHGTVEDPVQGAGDAARRVPPEVVEWVRAQPDALVRELVALVEVGEPDQEPVLLPAVPEESVRVVDDFTERAARDLRERREVLTVRDHIIGLEAAATAAEVKAGTRGTRLRDMKTKLEKVEAEVERLRARVRELETTERDRPAEDRGSAVGRAARRLRSH